MLGSLAIFVFRLFWILALDLYYSQDVPAGYLGGCSYRMTLQCAGTFQWILLLDGFPRISVLKSILTLDKTILKYHVQNIVGISYFCVRLYVQSYVYMVGVAFSVRVSRAHAVLPCGVRSCR